MVEAVQEGPSKISKGLRSRYEEAGQQHILCFLDKLSPERATGLVRQLEELDIQNVIKDFKKAQQAANNGTIRLQPTPLLARDLISLREEAVRRKMWKTGLEAIKNGTIAVVTLAGGQGTRLGSSAPKGCYNIGLPSGMSLFELQALRLRRLAILADAEVPWWHIMTSGATHDETVAFFKARGFFGIDPTRISFFRQGELPAIDDHGKIFMRDQDALAMSPNGNGGVFTALHKEGILEKMKEQGVQYVHMYCVDNCLVRVADPYFIGACIERQTDCAAKTVLKTNPTESVGVFCRRQEDGKMAVAEYSELDPVVASQSDSEGNLLFNQANIANHFFTVSFLQQIAQIRLPFHLARKKIPSISPQTGLPPVNGPPIGFKMEAFIFDVFEFAENPLLYQCSREEEFAPLKNAPATAKCDTPEYCRDSLLALHKRWLSEANANVDQTVEISPLISYAGENLERFSTKQVSGFLQ